VGGDGIHIGYHIYEILIECIYKFFYFFPFRVTVKGLDPGLPDSDTLFWRLSECASLDLIPQGYKKVVKYARFKEWLKKGAGLHERGGIKCGMN